MDLDDDDVAATVISKAHRIKITKKKGQMTTFVYIFILGDFNHEPNPFLPNTPR
jgi:hypothetical protein